MLCLPFTRLRFTLFTPAPCVCAVKPDIEGGLGQLNAVYFQFVAQVYK